MNPSVYIKTQGCKLNQSDSLSLSTEFHENGYEIARTAKQADVIVLNTCTVTATADSKARQYINATSKKHPSALVVITGCYAQSQSEVLEGTYPNCLILGNNDKPNIVSSVNQRLGFVESYLPSFLPKFNKTRAMVKIQEGCNQVCSYCIVPKVRGREKSIPMSVIISQVNNYHELGFNEVVLTGTQLGTYGFETGKDNLKTLIDKILSETSIPRIRVSSLQAHEIDMALLSLWSDQRLQNHFHIPLQSGDDDLLQSMRRRYTTSEFKKSVAAVRDAVPNVAITTDWIIGFPGESDAQFTNSARFVEDIQFSDIHPFPYSIRPGTSAAYLQDQVLSSKKKSRIQIAIYLKEQSAKNFKHSMLGKEFRVLWESRDNAGNGTGYTSNYIKVANKSTTRSNTITDEILLRVNENGEVSC